MTYFIRRGDAFSLTNSKNLNIHETLPPATYTIKVSDDGELYLKLTDSFSITTKLYGDIEKRTDRILNTFSSRNASTGVMLTGEKGSGKSLLAKLLAVRAQEVGIPTILVNAPHAGDRFNLFLQSISQPTIVLFDEFEKVYDTYETQHQLLTLFDGVFNSKKLFVLTCNNKYAVDSHLKNRPGRIFYSMDYNGLSAEFIVEYCGDNLNNTSYIEKIVNISSMFHPFNFDMLKALVEEMNRYDETPEQALEFLNIRPQLDEAHEYSVELTIPNITVTPRNPKWSGNPFKNSIRIEYQTPADNNSNKQLTPVITSALVWEKDDRESYQPMITFEASELMGTSNGAITFRKANGATLRLTPLQKPEFNYSQLAF